ncbi:MAG: transglutaminase [Deltaproteobacteria bacterium CG03_land_8_20_14_0_80_45_14]|nr:MAG: transglutaminase [Deltaproteobacteria bacterium CG03_land_8_20_14_0_80_45_14]
MNHKVFKPIAIVVLFFFSWTFAGVFQVAYAVDNLPQTSNNTDSSKTQKSEERFQKAIEEITEILENPATDRETKASKAKAKKGEIEELDKEIKKQFAETEKKLREAGLPHDILQRHHKFVKHYEDNLNELKANLDDIERAGTGLAAEVEIEKAKKHLQRVKAPRKHIPLDPNKLPHRTPKVERKEPRLKKEDFEKDFIKQKKAEAQRKPILVASNGSLKGLLSPESFDKLGTGSELSTPNLVVAQVSNLPTPEDLAENIEVQFTPEIIAKAQELGNNPVKIYNWVRNNIEFVPTYGSIQGANMTLLTKQGNAFDTASLLIALLRVSNIHARYVYGTIELPIEKAMNWAGGFTDADAALDFIASGGIPVTGIISGGKVTKARVEHTWVEAWIDYIPSRGAKHKTGQGDTWIPMDASFKQYIYKAGIDFFSSLSFNGEQFLQQYISDFQDTLPYQYYNQQMFSWLDVHMPNATIEDIIGADDIDLTKTIYEQNFPFLLGTLPYIVLVKGTKYSQIPDTLRHKVTIGISVDAFGGGGLTITKSLPELGGKRLTLSYVPATANDEALIAQYGGNILNVPPYLLNVKPLIKIEGIGSALGDSVGMGSVQTLTLDFHEPIFGMDVVENTVTAGAYSAITIQSQKTPVEIVTQRMEMLRNNSKNIDSVSLDDLLGELLHDIGLSYFHHLSFENDLYAKTFQMVYTKGSSEAVTTLTIDVSYLFGIPWSVSQDGLVIDVDRNITIPASLAGDMNRIKQFMTISGISSSSWEYRIFETFFGTPSVSAMKLLKYANQQGVPVYTIDSTNIDQLLPVLQVYLDVKMEIQNAINAGKKVIVPQSELQYYEWNGVGYVILDPLTGAGAYRISGGLEGGGTGLNLGLQFYEKTLYTEEQIGKFQRQRVFEIASSLKGTLHRYGDRDPSTGYIDCSGLVSFVYSQVGINDLGTIKSPKNAQMQYDYVSSVNGFTSNPQPGDLVFFEGTYDKNKDGVIDSRDGITHVGIYAGDNQYIASQQTRGVDTYFLTNDPKIGNWGQNHFKAYGRAIQ